MNTKYGYTIRVAKTMMTALRLTLSEITSHSQRDYVSLPARLRLTISMLLMLVLGSVNVWGQDTDYSGVYYIASKANKAETATTTTYAANDPANNFYLCPTEGWYYYVATNDFQTGSNDQPFLTTYKCKSADYHNGDPSDAVWIVRKHSSEANCYYIIQKSTGRYMISNGQIKTSNNANRVRVHLEEVADATALTAFGDKALFEITYDTDHWDIIPHSTEGRNGNNKYLVVNNGNFNNLKADGSKDDGPNGTYGKGTGGIISLYTHEDNAKFYLEDYVPTIFYNTDNQIEITVQDNETIIYTTDGSDPTDPNNSNRIEVNNNTTTFTIDEIKTINAVAVVNGTTLTKIATFTPIVLCGDTHSYLIQSQNNGWTIDENTTDFHFYMIPGDVDNNVQKVNTTSLFRPSMEWHFESAGVEDGVQFYYIVNNTNVNNTNRNYLCYDGTNNVHMETFSSDDKFKFKIVESATAGSFNIIPYAQRNASGNTGRFVNKPNDGNNQCNAGHTPIDLSGTSNAWSQWKFVQSSTLDKKAPFTVSDNDKSVYYKINSVGSNGYYIVPPSGTNTNATTSNSTDDNVIKTGAWYFEKAQDAKNDDWLTYYHIRNAETGKYLYFNKEDNNAGACLIMKETIESGNEDRYLFTWAKTAATEANYYIIPKLLKDKSLNKFSSLQRDNGTLKTNLTRGAGNYAWTFTPATLFCNDPVFKENDGSITISCVPDITRIYYTTDGTEPNPNDENQRYTNNTPFSASDPQRIKAISVVSNESTSVSSEVVTLLNKPDVTLAAGPYEYKAEAWEPEVTLSVGTTQTTTGFTPTYSNNVNAGTASVTITDADNTDYLYIWNVPVKEFTIDKKPLTITANNKNIEYGDEPANEGVYYSDFAGTETEENLEGTLNYSYTTSGDDPHPYTPYDPQYGTTGEYLIVPDGLTSTNYSISFIPGTLTVNKKSVERFLIEFDEDGNIILKSGDHILTNNVDYTIGEETSDGKYSTRNISGEGNYTGSITVKNAIVPFDTDNNQYEWTSTFVAESSGIGHALPEGVSAYIISSIQGEWAIPEPLDYIPAGVPVLLVARETKNGFLVKDANPEEVTVITPAQEGANMLEEVTEATPGYDVVTQSAPFATKQIYLLYKNEFVFNKAGNLKKGRVYLNPNHHPALSASAPARLMISWTIPTDVQSLPDERTEIDKEEVWYTIDGRRLDRKPNAKGLYIVNGMKIVVK